MTASLWSEARTWSDRSPLIAALVLVVLLFLAALILERVTLRALRRAYWRRHERLSGTEVIAEVRRAKRQQTILTLFESIVRYGLFGAASILALTIVTPGVSSALFGASLLVVLVGFGLQRLLGDMVAGALLLFEGHFSVGDVVTIHPQDTTGTVEDFSLRTTSLRTLGGDRLTVLNGTLMSFTRWSYGQREFRIEAIVRAAAESSADRSADPTAEDGAVEANVDGERGAAGVRAAVQSLCEAEQTATNTRYVRGPDVMLVEPMGSSDLVRLEIRVVVAPAHDCLAQRFATLLEAWFEEQVVGGVHVLNLYEPAFDSYRSSLLVRD